MTAPKPSKRRLIEVLLGGIVVVIAIVLWLVVSEGIQIPKKTTGSNKSRTPVPTKGFRGSPATELETSDENARRKVTENNRRRVTKSVSRRVDEEAIAEKGNVQALKLITTQTRRLEKLAAQAARNGNLERARLMRVRIDHLRKRKEALQPDGGF